MQNDPSTRTLIIFVFVLLAAVVLRPVADPSPAYAQANHGASLYIEPGTTVLRSPDGRQQVMGKVVIDLGTGKVWGFPTLTEKPYPVDTVHTSPPVSHPFYLGQMELSEITE